MKKSTTKLVKNSETNQKLSKLDGRMGNIEGKMGNLEGKIDKILGSMVTRTEFDQRLGTVVTKDHLDQRLGTVVTKDHLDQRLGTVVTKDYLDQRLGQSFDLLVTRAEFYEYMAYIKENMYTKADQDNLLSILDPMVAEFKRSERSNILTGKQLGDMDDKINGFDKRIKTLEKKVLA